MQTPVANAQVNLYATDPQSLAGFYQGLGLQEKFRFPPTGEPDQIELSIGSWTLGLTSRRALKQLAGLPADPGPPQTEVVFWCDDAAALYTKALALGAQPVAPPRVFNDRLRAAWVDDPEGHRLKLVSLWSAEAALRP